MLCQIFIVYSKLDINNPWLCLTFTCLTLLCEFSNIIYHQASNTSIFTTISIIPIWIFLAFLVNDVFELRYCRIGWTFYCYCYFEQSILTDTLSNPLML